MNIILVFLMGAVFGASALVALRLEKKEWNPLIHVMALVALFVLFLAFFGPPLSLQW